MASKKTLSIDKEREERGRDLLRFFLWPIVTALAAAVLLELDPLGLEEGTAKLAHERITKLSATLYPIFQPLEPDTLDENPSVEYRDEPVTVILIDEQYLEMAGRTWPLSYRRQGYLLDRIADYLPTAIFVDVVYDRPHAKTRDDPPHDDRPHAETDDDQPEHLLGAIHPERETPIIFAALPDGLGQQRGSCAGITGPAVKQKPLLILIAGKTNPGVSTAFVEWEGCGDGYPLSIQGDPKAITPAYALYQKWVQSRKQEPSVTSTAPPIILRWGISAPRGQRPFYKEAVCSYDDGKLWQLQRAAPFLKQLLDSIRPQGSYRWPERVNMRCPSINVIPASVIISTEPKHEPLRTLLQNKLVLVGTQIKGVADTITSPVHGQLPGVLLHAMATENLIRLESGYLKSSDSDGTPSWASVLFSCLVLIPIAMFAAHVPFKSARRPAEIFGLSLLILFAFLSWNVSVAALFILSGFILYCIAPTALTRAVISFSVVVIVSLVAIECGYEPANMLMLGIAAILVSEKVHSDLHSEPERAVILARLNALQGWCRATAQRVLRYTNRGAFR